jgi:WD40 repeat protein
MDTGLAFTPDLSLAAYAAGTTGNRIQVMDLQSGRELWSAPVKSGFVMALAFSPDGKILASAEGFNETDIRLWDVASGREIGQLAGHGAWVNSIVFWPDGKTLASSSADQTVRTWDVASRTCLDVLRGHRFGVWRVALLPDGKTLVSGCKDGTVCVWDTGVLHPRHPGKCWQLVLRHGQPVGRDLQLPGPLDMLERSRFSTERTDHGFGHQLRPCFLFRQRFFPRRTVSGQRLGERHHPRLGSGERHLAARDHQHGQFCGAGEVSGG